MGCRDELLDSRVRRRVVKSTDHVDALLRDVHRRLLLWCQSHVVAVS